jgi:hypothetical protein
MSVQAGPKGEILLMGPFTGPIADVCRGDLAFGDGHDGRV